MECIHAQQHTLQCYMHFEIQMFEQATQKLEITDKLKLMRRNDLTLRVSLQSFNLLLKHPGSLYGQHIYILPYIRRSRNTVNFLFYIRSLFDPVRRIVSIQLQVVFIELNHIRSIFMKNFDAQKDFNVNRENHSPHKKTTNNPNKTCRSIFS